MCEFLSKKSKVKSSTAKELRKLQRNTLHILAFAWRRGVTLLPPLIIATIITHSPHVCRACTAAARRILPGTPNDGGCCVIK